MFRHTFLLAYRSFLRFKSTFFINLIGLSTGLACTLFIYLWVNDELHIDKFHEQDTRLFQAMERQKAADGILVSEKTAGLVAPILTQEMPEHKLCCNLNFNVKYTCPVQRLLTP